MSRTSDAARIEEIRVLLNSVRKGHAAASQEFFARVLDDVRFLLGHSYEVDSANYALEGTLEDTERKLTAVTRDLAEQEKLNMDLRQQLERRTWELANVTAKLARVEKNYDAQCALIRRDVS